MQIQEEQAAGVPAILFRNSVALVPSWEVELIKLSLSSEEGSERVSAKPLKEYMVTTWVQRKDHLCHHFKSKVITAAFSQGPDIADGLVVLKACQAVRNC